MNFIQIKFFGGGKTSQDRDVRIDSIKFCLIFLVILGHVLNNSLFWSSGICRAVCKWIYLFHMPLFVFLSGYFSRKKDNKSFFKGIIKLLEPLILIQTIIITKQYFDGELTLKGLLTPWWMMWYLFSLICWRTILQILPLQLLCNARVVLLMSLLIGLIAGYFPFDKMLSLQRTLAFLPFFFLGFYLKGYNLFLPKKYKMLCILLLSSFIIVPIFWGNYIGDLSQADPYEHISGFLNRLFVFLISIPMSFLFINACPFSNFLSQQGRYTMQYYIYHSIIIIVSIYLIQRFSLPTTFGHSLLYAFLITFVIWVFSNSPLFDKLTNPSLIFTKHNKY